MRVSKKKIAQVLVLTVLVLTLLSACAVPNEPAPEATAETSTEVTAETSTEATDEATNETTDAPDTVEEVKIGWAQNASDENMNKMAAEFKAYIDEWNAAGKTPHVTLVTTNAETNIDKQISDIDSLIVQEVDVIVDAAVDTTGIIPAIQKAQASGVKWIETRGVDPDAVDYSYRTGEDNMALIAISWWHNLMDTNPDLNIKAGCIYGLASQTAQLVRVDDLIADLAESYPDRFEVIDKQYGDWDTAKSMEITENWLQSRPTMNCVIAAGGQMALGAVNAVVAANGDMSEWVFTTTDSTTDALSMINKGQLDMTVGINVGQIGTDLASYAIQVAAGTYDGPKKLQISEGVLFNIDSTNISDYYTES